MASEIGSACNHAVRHTAYEVTYNRPSTMDASRKLTINPRILWITLWILGITEIGWGPRHEHGYSAVDPMGGTTPKLLVLQKP
jgi:hypothetical protein